MHANEYIYIYILTEGLDLGVGGLTEWKQPKKTEAPTKRKKVKKMAAVCFFLDGDCDGAAVKCP